MHPREIRRRQNHTAITPDDGDTLFELFVLYQFVSTLEEVSEQHATFSTSQSGRQEVVRIDVETEIVLYHDSSAPGRTRFGRGSKRP